MRLILTIALLAFCVQANAAQLLKQSTAVTVKMGPFVDSTDGVTAETALTISQADVRLSKNGGDYAQKTDATAATHDEIGEYNVPLDATDTGTLGRLRVMVQETGALPVWAEFMVVPANVYDSLVLGTDTLQADTVQWLGTAAATPTTAGVPEVDVVLVDGAATSTSLASAADIADAVWDEPTAGHITGGTYGQQIFTEIDANGTVINTIAGYTDDIGVAGAGLTAIPWNAAWDAEVESEAADALTAGLGSIADAIWDEPTVGHTTGGTFGQNLFTEIDANGTLLVTANSALVTIDGNVDDIELDTNELQTDWADGGRLDLLLDTAAAGGGGGGTTAIDMQSTTIATLASQTSFTLTAGSADDDAYPAGSLVFVTDQSTSTQKCVGLLRSYTGATKTVTLAADPGIFTMATGDTVDIVYLGPPRVRGN